MPIESINQETCNGCEICVDTCPEDVLRLGNDKKAHIIYPQDCVGCLLCEFVCPKRCIVASWEMARPIPMPY